MSQLMQACSPATTDELVDIREVAVDKALPKEERIAAFLHQIKNPYRFRCGDFVVNFEMTDILDFFQRPCYDGLGKG